MAPNGIRRSGRCEDSAVRPQTARRCRRACSSGSWEATTRRAAPPTARSSCSNCCPGPYPLFAAESPADRSAFQQNDSLRVGIDSTVMAAAAARRSAARRANQVVLHRESSTGPGTNCCSATFFLPDAIERSRRGDPSLLGRVGASTSARISRAGSHGHPGKFHICGLVAEERVRLSSGTLDSLDASGEARFAIASRLAAGASSRCASTVPPFRARTMRVVDEQGKPIRTPG